MCLQRTWGNSDCSNWKRKQLKCMCIFFLLSFQMLLSSQGRGSQCRTLHAELLNEFFFMKAEWKTSLPLTPILSYWSVIVPRARQLLPPAPKWKGSSACIFKEDFDWSKIKQPQNILGDVNEKALDLFFTSLRVCQSLSSALRFDHIMLSGYPIHPYWSG